MRYGLRLRVALPTTPLLDFGPQTAQQLAIVTEKIMAIRWATNHIRRTQPSAPNPVVQPVAPDSQMTCETADSPHGVNGVGSSMLLVPTDPLVLFADLQDSRSGDVCAACRAEAFATECGGDLRVPLTITRQLMVALHHGGIADHLTLTEDRRDDHT